MANSKRQCRNCKSRFKVETGRVVGTAFYCSEDCQVEYGFNNRDIGKKKLQAEADKQHRKRKRDFYDNDKKLRMKEAVKAFNRFIRIRDSRQPCISCQRPLNSKYDAGHYRPAGINSALKFNELNCHAQCVQCNQHMSANLTNYRIHLVVKIGPEAVEELEGNNEIKRWTCEELKQIELHYKAKCKELEKRQAA